MQREGQTHKRRFPIVSYTWIHQCWPTSNNFLSWALCKYKVPSRWLALHNDWAGQRERWESLLWLLYQSRSVFDIIKLINLIKTKLLNGLLFRCLRENMEAVITHRRALALSPGKIHNKLLGSRSNVRTFLSKHKSPYTTLIDNSNWTDFENYDVSQT